MSVVERPAVYEELVFESERLVLCTEKEVPDLDTYVKYILDNIADYQQ